ncbi:hypothetical protein BDV93DRAFT_595556 [Ceratobasidium sp. AG-I]|nr:hypothetical protein BDV93DRAFT_595556 [Ceratobasidium sp. AG-I]
MLSLATRLLVYAPLLSHLITTVGIALATIYVLDGRSFNLTSRNPTIIQVNQSLEPSRNYKLLQSDVTTFVSVANVVVRSIVGSWCGISGWRAAFILLEKGEITISELSRLVEYQRPPIHLHHRLRNTKGIYIPILAALLLPTLAKISAPVLSGSIAWLPSLDYVHGNENLKNIPASGLNGRWGDMQTWAGSDGYSTAAAGPAIRAWSTSAMVGDARISTSLRRSIPSAYSLPINSTLANITVPFFRVDSIEWLNETELNAMDPILRGAIDASSTVLRYGPTGDNPLWIQQDGTVAVLKNTTWQANQTFPSPITLVGEYYIAIRIGQNITGSDCLPLQLAFFGPESPAMAYGRTGFSNAPTTNCHGFARIRLRAGVGQCYNCRIIAPSVVQNTSDVTLVPDVLTQEAMNLLPTTVAKLVSQNASLVPIYNNLNEYVAATLTQAYSGAWMGLINMLQPPHVETAVQIPILVSKARVDSNRVWIWLGMHLCFTLSGMLLLSAQTKCERSIVVDPALEVLFLDTTKIAPPTEVENNWVLTPVDTHSGEQGMTLRQR